MSENNFNYENRFNVIFSSESYKDLVKNIVAVSIPDINIGYAIYPTAIKDLHVPGDSLEFGDVTFTLLLDEDYANYRSFVLWINELRNFREIQNTDDIIDINIVLLNGKYNPFLSIHLEDCFPYAISEIPLNHQLSDLDPIQFTVTMKVNNYTIE